MDLALLLTLAAVVLLLMTSGFFSGSETALTAVSRARIHAMVQEGTPNAKTVDRLIEQPERIIGTVLLGNNLVNILASALTTSLLIAIFGEAGVVYATIGLTLIVVIFCEVLPKTYAIAFPERFALTVAPAMRWLIVILSPITRLIEAIVKVLLAATPGETDDKSNILAAKEEIRGTIELSKRDGAVERDDADRLGGVLDLRELQVSDIMVHRTRIATINADDSPGKIVDDLLRSQHTRLPIWRESPDNIIGVLHSKNVLASLSEVGWDPEKLDISALASEPWFVPDTTEVNDQLNSFLREKAQLALIVDEYGEVAGLVTLEDILEEIVGQITDEHDPGDTSIRPQTDGSVNVDGGVAIRDLNREMDWDLPDEEATTIAGLVIHEAQTIPEPGQSFTFHGYRFEVLRKSRNKITALRLKPAVGGATFVDPAEASAAK
ncbi:MAG: HlyC/CorC family transporter [Pseudomonadota bacterium]